MIARQIWPRDPANPLHYKAAPLKDDHGPVGYAAASAGYLGRMYLRGEGVKADLAIAKMWFERGAEHGDRESHNGLGIIYRDGFPGIKSDLKTALVHFGVAAGQELAEAQVNMGKYHYGTHMFMSFIYLINLIVLLDRGELGLATTYFETAVRYGSPLEAYYYLGEIAAAQASAPSMLPHIASSSCAMAVSFYKLVSERGVWDDDLLRDAEIAWMSASDHGKEIAMLKWWIAAERGSEIAQNNLAYVLDQGRFQSLAQNKPSQCPHRQEHLAPYAFLTHHSIERYSPVSTDAVVASSRPAQHRCSGQSWRLLLSWTWCIR